MNGRPAAPMRSDPPVLLAAENVVAGYRDRFEVGPLTMAVRAGEVWGVVGPNGSGKTTLLKAMSGLLPCRRGRILLEGRDGCVLSARERARRMAWLPQEIEASVPFTVRELVALGRLPHASGWAPLSAADHAAIEQALQVMDLIELAARPLHELSSGERQRALVAMTAAQQPRVLVLDEPTAHLDIQHAAHLMSAVVRRTQDCGMGVVASLHDLNLAAAYCHRLILLDRGRVVAIGSPKAVLRQDVVEKMYRIRMDILRREDGTVAVLPRYEAGVVSSDSAGGTGGEGNSAGGGVSAGGAG